MPRKWPTDPALKKIPVPIVPPIAVFKKKWDHDLGNKHSLGPTNHHQMPALHSTSSLVAWSSCKGFPKPRLVSGSNIWDREVLFLRLGDILLLEHTRLRWWCSFCIRNGHVYGSRSEEKGGNNAEKFAVVQGRSYSISININHREEDTIFTVLCMITGNLRLQSGQVYVPVHWPYNKLAWNRAKDWSGSGQGSPESVFITMRWKPRFSKPNEMILVKFGAFP